MFKKLVLLLLFGVPAHPGTEVYFSPNGGCAPHLVAAVCGATRTLDLAVYAINDPVVVEAILRAKERGVRVRMLCDKSQSEGRTSLVGTLKKAGISLYVVRGSGGGIMHDKFAVYDRGVAGKARVSAGSYNWTVPGQKKNDENEFFCDEERVVEAYGGRFDALWGRASSLSEKARPRPKRRPAH